MNKESFRIKITDFGFSFVKKYRGMRGAYTNKDQYTAPELLKLKGSVSSASSAEGDVYSLGMIIWFIINEAIPFEGLNYADLLVLVLEEEKRPSFKKEAHHALADISKECWKSSPQDRPSLEKVEETLIKIASNLIG